MAEANLVTSDSPFFCYDCEMRISPISDDNIYECPQCHGKNVAKVNDSGRLDLASLAAGLNEEDLERHRRQQASMDLWKQSLLEAIQRSQETLRTFDPPDLSSIPIRRAQQLVHDAQRKAEELLARGARDERDLDRVTVLTYVRNLFARDLDKGGIPPLSKEEIEAIPRTEISETMRNNSSQCSVCFDNFTVGESVRQLICGHFFHDGCIVPWVEQHAVCPLCRQELGFAQGAPTRVEGDQPRDHLES